MKVSKEYLNRVIKEELQKILKENICNACLQNKSNLSKTIVESKDKIYEAKLCKDCGKYLKRYIGHSALNLGQAAKDAKYFLDHPHADKVAKQGTLKHKISSAASRLPSLVSNLYYSALPPDLHHSEEELEDVDKHSAGEWFKRGYKPWEYEDEEEK